MNVGEQVRHRDRPDCGIGEIVRIYPDGHCDVVFSSTSFSWIPLSCLASVKEEEKQRKVREEMLLDIRKSFQDDFLGADALFRSTWSPHISDAEYRLEKLEFVKRWTLAATGTDLDNEQAAAVASVHGHVRVTARAGSGKTTTLVSRAHFLCSHCRVSPNEMLLLAFNKKAAEEMAARLERNTGSAFPHVMTFHALAYAIVHPEESILHNGPPGESQGLSRAFQQVIDDHLQLPQFRTDLRTLMLAHFREDWDRIVQGCYDKSRDELLQFRRSLPRESLRGDYVKSFGEKLIADFLFEHDVDYKYERNHWWEGINYRPDFTVLKTATSGIIIEYFGLEGDPDYDEMSEEKRNYWRRKHDWILLEYSPRHIAARDVEAFKDLLREALEARGIRCARLPEDEIWRRIRDRAIDRFTTACIGFLGRCRKRWLLPAEVDALIDRYAAISDTEHLFLSLASVLYKAYLNRLDATGEEDFDGLMQRASEKVRSGATVFDRRSERGDVRALRHILIDEFQDFSELFQRLVTAIRTWTPGAAFFCVGDDWQAINGFAGSDLRFFRDFGELFGDFSDLSISTNRRSEKRVVEAGNALMSGRGKPALYEPGKGSGEVLVADLADFRPSTAEKDKHAGDILTPTVLRIASRVLGDDLDIVLICRRNGLPWYIHYHQADDATPGTGLDRYLALVRGFFPKDLHNRISISTAHKYKGRQKDVVVILDAVARSYPLIHPDWAFSRILGDTPQGITDEERRLFYVAMTRAVHRLVLITERGTRSPFLDDLDQCPALSALDWVVYPPHITTSGSLIVKIGNQERRGIAPTLAIRDALKSVGYRWHSTGWKGWAKSFASEQFTVDTLKREVWARDADGIEVRILDERDFVVCRYIVDRGEWKEAHAGVQQWVPADGSRAARSDRH